MAQRVRRSYRGRERPSSVTQLPILTALHAGSPTLFEDIIHEKWRIVNSNFAVWVKKYGLTQEAAGRSMAAERREGAYLETEKMGRQCEFA